ncbi:MAG: lipoyl synthase [Candidatus Aegiribacteria sp.]|nr:lipoyl synthase [Candidatus Aegiribacteria sp.]
MTYKKKPSWLKMPSRGSEEAAEVRSILRKYNLNTVCRQAKCPNLGHCFQRGTATFLILGNLCTRSCRYCAIEHNEGILDPPDAGEPDRIAEASAEMNLRYVVITSVTRDDLQDGGADHFGKTVEAVRKKIPGVRIEVLTPDFLGSEDALRTIANSKPDVFNHNLETVERLFPDVRPEASYGMSLDLIELYGRLSPDTPRKSGLMLGLGEKEREIRIALQDLRKRGVTMLTLGQYLQPSRMHWPVDSYLTPDEFSSWKDEALRMGFVSVASGPLVRSSFHADESFPASGAGPDI